MNKKEFNLWIKRMEGPDEVSQQVFTPLFLLYMDAYDQSDNEEFKDIANLIGQIQERLKKI